MEIPTIKVKAAGGFMVINKADFDPKKHQLWSEPKPRDEHKDGGR